MVKNARFHRSPTLCVQLLKTNDDTIRWGITVSKKVDKKAVNRNFMKRRLRALVQQHTPEIACSVVLIATRHTLTCAFSALLDDYKAIVSKCSASENH